MSEDDYNIWAITRRRDLDLDPFFGKCDALKLAPFIKEAS